VPEYVRVRFQLRKSAFNSAQLVQNHISDTLTSTNLKWIVPKVGVFLKKQVELFYKPPL